MWYLSDLFFHLISDNIYKEARTYVSVDSENLIDEFSKNIIDQPLKDSFDAKFKEYI